jgi:hypothetical protein
LGGHLVVGDVRGIELFAIEPDGTLRQGPSESALRRAPGPNNGLRIWHGVSTWAGDRVLAANWDYLDVYRLVESGGSEPDLTVSKPRLRFAPAGGSETLQLYNEGCGTLEITDIVSTEPTFSAQPTSASLEPGEALDVTIDYAGGPPGTARLHVLSNDPDEDPLPIQVFGETDYLDPGEPAIPFTLPAWTYDHADESFVHGSFDLSAYAGRVVYFQVFGTW